MSLYDFESALKISERQQPFPALVMAAWLRADERNRARLAGAFPAVVDELERRLRSPGGVLPTERDFEDFEAMRR